MEIVKKILNYSFQLSDSIHISVKVILVLILAFIITSILLKIVRKLVNKNLEEEDKGKFKSVFSFTVSFLNFIRMNELSYITFMNESIAVLEPKSDACVILCVHIISNPCIIVYVRVFV